MKKRAEIEAKMEQLGEEIHGTEVSDWARKECSLFKHGAYEILAWVLESWSDL